MSGHLHCLLLLWWFFKLVASLFASQFVGEKGESDEVSLCEIKGVTP